MKGPTLHTDQNGLHTEERWEISLAHSLPSTPKAITIKDSRVLPILESFADSLGGHGCYTGLDLFMASDHMTSLPSRLPLAFDD